jgi:hypothetical protein
MDEIVWHESNTTALRAISDLDCLDCLACLLFPIIHFNNHKLELDQITNIKKLSTHLMAFAGTVASPACYPNNFTVPYHPVVDC